MLIPLRKAELSDQLRIHQLRDEVQSPLTATSELSILPWRDYFGFSLYDGGSFILVWSQLQRGFLYPFGDAEQAFDFLFKAYSGEGKPRFVYLSGKQASALQDKGYLISSDPDAGEYIYESKALALQDGAISKNLRRKFRSFAQNTEYSVETLTPEKLPLYMQRITALSEYRDDLPAVLDMLTNFERYGYFGISIQSGEKWAVIAGYQSTQDTFTMGLVEYSDDFGNEVVPVCIKELAERVCDRYRYINLEEDLGLEGLRRMKTLYKPAYVLEAFVADDAASNPNN